MRSHVAVLIAVFLVVGSAGVPLAAGLPGDAVAATDSTAASAQLTDDEIRMTTTLDRTPDRVGEITATTSFRFPDRVTEFTARLPEGATVTETDGFDRETASDYAWDERTDQPSVTFRVDADRLTDQEGPLAEDGRYLFTETDEWALVQIPSLGIEWTRTGSPSDDLEFVRETTVSGPGVAGDRMAFLGPHEVETHTAHGQTFRLVVPEAADLEPSSEEVFDSLSHASDRLRVGDRDPEVFVVAAPTESVSWGVRGLQVGDSDMWVQDSEEMELATNVWLHEYVHTRQSFETTDETQWLREATATYYGASLALEGGHVDFDRFRRVLDRGEEAPQSNSVLSQPDSWENNANYWKGSLVVGDTDRSIRAATDSESSFEAVFRSLNSHATDARDADPVTAGDLEAYLGAAGGSEVAAASMRYATTDAAPTMWDSRTHGEVFGQLPAQFRYSFAADDPIRVSGDDGSRSLNGTSGTLTVGETLTVEMVAENVGGTVGDYELLFRVNESQTTASGRLRPNESSSHRFDQTFSEPGRYTVSVGDEQLDIRVVEPDRGLQEPIGIETPGFGVGGAVSALLLSGLLARRRA
ncbi:PGF-CTERM sorting domain-containing protein [Halohasta litorea]|uniref:PGF-CTERM sorting domain-containing protein n=1 Tax=Halohasta litorea TaxID=869891 RepID=A0ABD6D6E5_9EURY|nr:PGF-CTERM sorting domain-containing protein [Halohasta litorea]